MSVFSKIRGFFSRHRNKFIIGSILVGGSIYLTHFAQQKLREWQEKEALEFLERNRKMQHFESIGRTCNQTILNLSASLNDRITGLVNTDELIERLKENPDNKLGLWNELKVLVFTKASCSVYATVMLVVTLKVQLSIVGGYLYKDPNGFTTETQERYLSQCQGFLNNGITRLSRLIERTCKKVLENVDLKKQLKIGDLEAIFWSIQTSIATDNDNPLDKLKNYILPEAPSSSTGVYSQALQDLSDLLDSDEVKSIATHCSNRGFLLLVEQLSEFYQNNNNVKENGIYESPETFTNPYNIRKPMAKLIPILNGICAKKSLPDQFLQQLTSYEKLHALSANVYESML